MREKTWRRFLNGQDGVDTNQWAERSYDYWRVQGTKYGVLFDIDDIHLSVHPDKPLVTTRCRVLAVLKGSRIDEKTWRKRNPPAKLLVQSGVVTQ